MKFLTIGFMLSFSIATNVAAQSNASYEETVEFIYGKLVGSNDGWTHHLSFPQKCKLHHMARRDDGHVRAIYEVDLKDLDPSKVEWYTYATNKSDGYIRLRTKENLNKIRYQSRENRTAHGCDHVADYGFTPQNTENFCKGYKGVSEHLFSHIRSPRPENGQRVARAFTHLIGICGGKEELF